MKKEYIQPTVKIIACNLQPLMIRESWNNSSNPIQNQDGFSDSSIDDKSSIFSRKYIWEEDDF